MSNELKNIEDNVSNGIVESIKNAVMEIVKQQISNLIDRTNEAKETAEEAKEIAEISRKVNTGSKVYFTQTDLGNTYKPTISSVAVGQILRIIGLAYKTTPTRPLRTQAVETGIAKMVGQGYQWERDKVDEKWINWLKDNDLYVEWSKHTTATERRLFIKELHDDLID